MHILFATMIPNPSKFSRYVHLPFPHLHYRIPCFHCGVSPKWHKLGERKRNDSVLGTTWATLNGPRSGLGASVLSRWQFIQLVATWRSIARSLSTALHSRGNGWWILNGAWWWNTPGIKNGNLDSFFFETFGSSQRLNFAEIVPQSLFEKKDRSQLQLNTFPRWILATPRLVNFKNWVMSTLETVPVK